MAEENKVKKAEATESKHDKFKRLAVARTNKVLAGIRKLKNLSSRSSYDYTDGEVEQIFSEIEKELAECRAAFNGTPKRFRLFEFTETE